MSAATAASRSTPGGRNSAVFTIPIGGGPAFLAFLRVAAGTGAGAASFGEAVPASAEAENVRREGTQALVSGGGATARKREGRGRRSIAAGACAGAFDGVADEDSRVAAEAACRLPWALLFQGRLGPTVGEIVGP